MGLRLLMVKENKFLKFSITFIAFSSTNQFNSNNDDQNKKLEQENLINKNPKK